MCTETKPRIIQDLPIKYCSQAIGKIKRENMFFSFIRRHVVFPSRLVIKEVVTTMSKFINLEDIFDNKQEQVI